MCDCGLSCDFDYSPSTVWNHGYVIDLSETESNEVYKHDKPSPFAEYSRSFDERWACEIGFPFILRRHHKEAVNYCNEHNLSKKRIYFAYPDVQCFNYFSI